VVPSTTLEPHVPRPAERASAQRFGDDAATCRCLEVLGAAETLATLADEGDEFDDEIVLALEVAAAASSATRGETIDVLGAMAASGHQRAADALARLGEARVLEVTAATPTDQVRRVAYLADPSPIDILRQVILDPDTDDDTATMAACGLVRTAFQVPASFAQ
jgi:hypothetical protein